MTHEKLVAGTTSPTRYTKIVRNPGAGTKYNRTYQEVDYVSRYTKTVAGGKDYVPPAPPAEPLAIAEGKGANWVGTNVYEIGQTVEARTAEYVGGVEPVTYRYRFQTKAKGADTWVNKPWTNTTNAKNPIFYTIEDTGQVKFQSQARDGSDPVVQLNSVAGIKTIDDPSALVVSTPVVTGEPIVGHTLTCSEPTVSGGVGPYQLDYFWVDESNAIVWEAGYMGNTTTVVEYDLGKMMKCMVQVTDKGYAKGESVTVVSNEVGPISNPPTIGTPTITINDVAVVYGEPIHVPVNTPVHAVVTITGDASPSYKWEARGDYPMMVGQQAATTTLTFPEEGGPTVTLTMLDSTATDSPISYAMSFYVASQAEWELLHPEDKLN